jgi:hypothetical protein
MEMRYTVLIKRKWLPGYTKYVVKDHEVDARMGQPRIILMLSDGSLVALWGRDYIVCPDYQAEVKRIKAERAQEKERIEFEAFKQQQAMQDVVPIKPAAVGQMPPVAVNQG